MMEFILNNKQSFVNYSTPSLIKSQDRVKSMNLGYTKNKSCLKIKIPNSKDSFSTMKIGERFNTVKGVINVN